jgi:hypothetical protein
MPLALRKKRYAMQCENEPNKRCGVDSQVNLLLQEFRAFRDNEWRIFRDQVVTWKEEDRARLTELEVHSKDIVGNGQPGRMANVEEKTSKLEKYKYWLIGIAAGVSGIVSILVVIAGVWIDMHFGH